MQVLPAGGSGESFEVQARGELQLGLLMGGYSTDQGYHQMRRLCCCHLAPSICRAIVSQGVLRVVVTVVLSCATENMRREGFEFAVSPPKVVYRCIAYMPFCWH